MFYLIFIEGIIRTTYRILFCNKRSFLTGNLHSMYIILTLIINRFCLRLCLKITNIFTLILEYACPDAISPSVYIFFAGEESTENNLPPCLRYKFISIM
ncbi:Uncharacterised protein [Klebsiella pneumoniae]|uniref:Uncharacterized protein n=1 Tax=Klebsiella pneumoniae TaxID=573 RepID=A0A4P0Y0E8_KLEPN|nr:Uncharacterised protein [Klebsiella pneumoniae]